MEAGLLRFTEKLKAAVSELQLFGKEAVDFWKIRKKKILIVMYTESPSLRSLNSKHWPRGIQHNSD